MHHWLTTIFDSFENAFLWLDSAIMVVCVVSLVYILNEDLIQYEQLIHVKIELALERAQRQTVASELGLLKWAPQWSPLGRPRPEVMEMADQEEHQRRTVCIESLWQADDMQQHGGRLPAEERLSLDEEALILDLQAQICDFFRQIKRLDLFLSDVLSMAILIWPASSTPTTCSQAGPRAASSCPWPSS